MENKLKASEENREIIIKKTKEDVAAYLSKVEQKVRDLEVTTEAEKIAKKIAMDADVMKVDQKRNEQLEKRIKELQDHEDYVKHVLASQEMKKKNYLANLEKSLDKASKRKEDHLARVVETGQVEDQKIAEAKEKRELSEREMQAKTLAALTEKLTKVEEVSCWILLGDCSDCFPVEAGHQGGGPQEQGGGEDPPGRDREAQQADGRRGLQPGPRERLTDTPCYNFDCDVQLNLVRNETREDLNSHVYLT